MRVLVAEDDALSRLLLSSTLEGMGHTPVVVGDGRKAWEAYRAAPAPIVLTDWIMPGIGGLDLCRMIRAEARSAYTYVILITVLEGKGRYLEGMDAGADDLLTKPVDPDQLGARLRVAERILGLQRELRRLEALLPICAHCRRVRDGDARLARENLIARRVPIGRGTCAVCSGPGALAAADAAAPTGGRA